MQWARSRYKDKENIVAIINELEIKLVMARATYYKQPTDITNDFYKHGAYVKVVAIEKGKWSVLGDILIVKLTISCVSVNVTKGKNQLVKYCRKWSILGDTVIVKWTISCVSVHSSHQDVFILSFQSLHFSHMSLDFLSVSHNFLPRQGLVS